MASPEILSLPPAFLTSIPFSSLPPPPPPPSADRCAQLPLSFLRATLVYYSPSQRHPGPSSKYPTHSMSRPQRFPSSSELRKQSAYLQSPSSASTSSTSLLPKMQQGQSTSSFTPVFMDQQAKRSSGKGPRTSYLYVSLMSAGTLDISLIITSMITAMANVEVGVRSLM